MKIYPTLTTERLLLRKFQVTDASVIQELAGAYEVAEMTLNIPHPYLEGMAEIWMESHQEEFEAGMGIVFAIEESQTKKLAGAIGLVVTKRFNRGELGYWVGQPYWGKGYATEAAHELLRYGFETIKLNKISATHMTRNPASGRVMQKIGMEKEGVLKQHALKWDQFVDLAAYGILADNWSERQQT
mgnify:CR=1 FL=1